MLALRLSRGLVFSEYEQRFKKKYPDEKLKKAAQLSRHGLVTLGKDSMSLTENGFLLSNSIIAELA